MEKTVYKFETTNEEEVNRWLASLEMAEMLSHLKLHFVKKWESKDPPPGYEVLNELKKLLLKIDINKLIK